MPTKDEDAIRTYLLSLTDPQQLVDRSRVKQLQSKLARSKDPMERLQLREQIEAAKKPEVHHAERGFVEYAKHWAEKSGIGVEAFLAEGVPATALRKAGFRVPRDATSRMRSTSARRGKRVSIDESALPRKGTTFTVSQLADQTGASKGAVSKFVREQVAAGHVEEVGSDPGHVGPGRPPKLYQKK